MNDKGPTLLWKRYQDSLAYTKRMNLKNIWDECENFVEGKHWPLATPRTRDLPRPVINLCNLIADNKKAGILSTKVKLVYRPAQVFFDLEKADKGADLFTKFVEIALKDLKQDDLDDKAQDDATQLGSYAYHYFWDSNVVGNVQSPYLGALRGEIIEPQNIFFSNPMIQDEQKQSWIIIVSSEPVESIRQLAKQNGIKEWANIKADYEIEDESFKDKKMCTVITQYSRKNGKVVWTKATKDVYVQEPTYWEPNLNKSIDEDLDLEETKEPDNPKEDSSNIFENQLYPIVFGIHKKRKRCIYGIGEVEQAIPNNRAVNFNLGMMLLSVQQTAWPKIIQKAGALARQIITNTPGEIITDTTQQPGVWGVKYLESPGFNAQALTLTNTLMDLTRTTQGSTEVVTGEVLGANMAASAIIALQNQAKKPIELYQKKFFRSYEKIGAILLQFFKYYYNDGRMFVYETEDKREVGIMNGQAYSDFDYSVVVEAGSAGTFSESLSISLLDQLKQDGTIDQDEYIELYPDSIMTFKAKLKQMRQKKKEEQQLLALEQAQSQIPVSNNDINPNMGL